MLLQTHQRIQTHQGTQTIGHNMDVPMVINACSKMNGELILTTDTRVDGKVFGKVESDRNIIIGTAGYIKGFLRVNNLVSFGRIEGNVIVSGTTVLHPGSSIFGNLYTKVIEVKEGAIITARVSTYEKLEALDEAKLYLAEELFTKQSSRMNNPVYTKEQISFDENEEISDVEPETDFLNEVELEEIVPEWTMNFKSEESPKIEKHQEELVEEIKKELRRGPFYDLFKHESEKKDLSQISEAKTEIILEPSLHLDDITTPLPLADTTLHDIPNTLNNSEIAIQTEDTQLEIVAGDTQLEIVQQSTIIEVPLAEINNNVQEEEKVSESVPETIPEPISETPSEPVPEPISKPLPINESVFDIEPEPITDKINRTEETSKPIVNSALFASLMGQPVKEGPIVINESNTDINENNAEQNKVEMTSEKKGKGRSIFGRDEFNHLFNHKKDAIAKSAEKDEPKSNNRAKSFLSESIKELPPDDYSSLYK